jgi:hypothetical protein
VQTIIVRRRPRHVNRVQAKQAALRLLLPHLLDLHAILIASLGLELRDPVFNVSAVRHDEHIGMMHHRAVARPDLD